MPNIEIHGYGYGYCFESDRLFPIQMQAEVFAVKEKIGAVMRDIGLGGDAIITIFPSMASTCDGKNTPSPYIRISNTKPEETQLIISALKKNKILLDTETLTLASFIPGGEMG